jgi:hypothetical protein
MNKYDFLESVYSQVDKNFFSTLSWSFVRSFHSLSH